MASSSAGRFKGDTYDGVQLSYDASRGANECLNINIFWSLTQAGGHQRLEGGLQPRPVRLRARLPGASCLRCAAPIHDRLSLTVTPMSPRRGR